MYHASTIVGFVTFLASLYTAVWLHSTGHELASLLMGILMIQLTFGSAILTEKLVLWWKKR